jgi:hypothetical protein
VYVRVGPFLALPGDLGDDRALEDVGQDEAGMVMWIADAAGSVVDVAHRHFPIVQCQVRQILLEDRGTGGGRRLRLSEAAGRDEFGKQRERSNGISACNHHDPAL